MVKAIQVIQREHRGISSVLHCLDCVVRDIDIRGTTPDFELLHAIIDYICSFLFRFHHPKEDLYLFHTLRRRCPDSITVLDQLEEEHRIGDRLVENCRQALYAYERIGESAFQAFKEAVDAYRSLEETHMIKEEREVIPRARDCLKQEDWAEIDAVFTDHEDPLFGECMTEKYEKLFSTIVKRCPLPHGTEVSESWHP